MKRDSFIFYQSFYEAIVELQTLQVEALPITKRSLALLPAMVFTISLFGKKVVSGFT